MRHSEDGHHREDFARPGIVGIVFAWRGGDCIGGNGQNQRISFLLLRRWVYGLRLTSSVR